MKLSGRHQKTLKQAFAVPVSSSLRWDAVEALLVALGAEVSEGRGSRVRVMLNGVRAVFHRPHPQKEMDRGAVVSLQGFLRAAGVED